MRLRTFQLQVKVFYECKKLLSYATKPVEKSMVKVKYLNLKDLTCLDCLYLIILKIDQYGTDCLEGWKRRYPLSEPKWDTNLSLCCFSVQITLIICWNYAILSLYAEGLLSFEDRKKKRDLMSSKWMNWSNLPVQVIPLPSGNKTVGERDGSYMTLLRRKCISNLWDLARKYMTAREGYLKHCLIF